MANTPPGITSAQLDSSSFGGIGDFTPEGQLIICCGDSTTEQFNANNGGSEQVVKLRQIGEAWANIVGFVNFGGSGYTLSGFVNDSLGTTPTIPTTGIAAVNNWDYYGHKPTGAISQATTLAWRSGKADKALWRICYGINDLILYAATGNLSQSAIVAYLAPLLRTAIQRITTAYPRDSIVLEIPNPMTARPYNSGAGFPSVSAYPAFGSVIGDDQALVEKWNQALRATYILVQNQFPKTRLIDSWADYFGLSDTTLTAATQLPFLANLVHPTGIADAARIRGLARLTKPKAMASEGRRVEADSRATLLSVNPWDIYPGYFRENVRYKMVAEFQHVGAGSSYIDLGITYAKFLQQITGGIYVVIGDRVAQYFATYNAGPNGSNTRLTGLTVTAAMQSAASGQSVQIYLDNTLKMVSGDSYVNGLAISAKEYIEVGTITSAGVGYIDISLPGTTGRVSSKFAGVAIKNGVLVVGGTVNSTLALSVASQVSRSGTTSQRAMRISIPGSYAGYIGQPAAITFDDSQQAPKAFERIPKVAAFIPHAIGNKSFVFAELPMLDGATMGVTMVGQIASIVTVEVYSLIFPNRTLIGTISVPANSNGANLASGNPITVAAGTAYEFVITSVTSGTAPIICSMTPM